MPQGHEGLLVYYLYHSGFAVITPHHILVFDYFRDCPSGCSTSIESILAGHPDKTLVVFVSHSHHDHYNEVIWSWRHHSPVTQYVVDNSVPTPSGIANVIRVEANEQYVIDGCRVSTLASTDEGVAFLVEIDGRLIYHAGDLNWWHWEGEPDDDNIAMGIKFRQEIDRLPACLDIAFVPVDPRLESTYALGLTYLMSRVDARIVFPMHFGDNFSIFHWLKRDLTPEAESRIAEITPSPLPFYLD